MKNFSILITIISLTFTPMKAQWIPVGNPNLGGDIMALLENNEVLFAGGTAYLYRSSDGGLNWTGYFLQFAYAWSLAKSNNYIYCGLSFPFSQTPGVYRSNDNGLNWEVTALSNKNIFSLAADNSQVLASDNFAVYRSTDNGQSWNSIGNYGTSHLYISGNRIYSASSGLKVTTDFGLNWTLLHNDPGISVIAEDSIIFFGTQDGKIHRSTNYGQSWETTFNKPGAYVYSLYKYGQNVFAGTDSGFYVSTNNGESFFSKNDNLGISRIQAILVYNNYVFVGSGNYAYSVSVWKRPLSEILDVEDQNNSHTNSFVLYQNYPNPFNLNTKIIWESPVGSHQTLKVYDLLGKEIATLVDEYKPAGKYEVKFNVDQISGLNLNSGVYFYQLKIGETETSSGKKFIQTKKMIYLK